MCCCGDAVRYLRFVFVARRVTGQAHPHLVVIRTTEWLLTEAEFDGAISRSTLNADSAEWDPTQSTRIAISRKNAGASAHYLARIRYTSVQSRIVPLEGTCCTTMFPAAHLKLKHEPQLHRQNKNQGTLNAYTTNKTLSCCTRMIRRYICRHSEFPVIPKTSTELSDQKTR